jgi:choline kinase
MLAHLPAAQSRSVMTSTAVVLAAGASRRLRPLTDDRPKCLLDIGGQPLLARLFDAFAAAGVQRVVVVTGYLSERIDEYLKESTWPFDVRSVRNHQFDSTNNAASLALAKPIVGARDFVLSDGDVIFSPSPIPALLAAAEPCALLVDRGATLNHEEMKVQIDGDGRVLRLSKDLEPEASAGESIGIQKVGGPAVALLWETLDRLLPGRSADAYYEEAFQQLVDRGVRFGICPVESETWMEIDDAADLHEARHRFGAG